MQLIVTCAGCGAKYRGESSPKKFRCAACSNLFTFPEKASSPSTGTILCSNCWTETVPTEKLKTCGSCSQRVSPRYGGQASEDKQIKVKQANIRTDPNLVKAATNKSGAEIPVSGSEALKESGLTKFSSGEWKELTADAPKSNDMHPDLKKTQAFELMAELKQELESEMAGVVESMQHQQDDEERSASEQESQPATRNSGVISNPTRVSGTFQQLTGAAAGNSVEHNAGLSGRFKALETQLQTEAEARQNALLENESLMSRIGELEARLSQEQAMREGGNQDDATRSLQEKVAELTGMIQTDKRAREQLLRERLEMEELWRERDAKVTELTARLEANPGQSHLPQALIASGGGDDSRQELEEQFADFEARLSNEKRARESLIRERDQLSDNHREVEARVADLETRLESERGAKDLASKQREELLEAKGELEAQLADLESRLTLEREAKEGASAEREKLKELRKELEAKAADLTRRHTNEREAKERAVKEHAALNSQHAELNAKMADIKSRLKSEQDNKDAVRRERDEALARADQAESLIKKSEAETGRLRKGLQSHLDRVSVEYNSMMSKHAAKISELATHAKQSRKRLEEEAQAHSSQIESATAELKQRLEQDGAEISQRLAKLVHEHQNGFASSQSGRHTTISSLHALPESSLSPQGSGVHDLGNTPISSKMFSASAHSGQAGQNGQTGQTAPAETEGSGSNKAVVDPAANSGSSSPTAAVTEPSETVDKNSGTFWAKVFKRPAQKT